MKNKRRFGARQKAGVNPAQKVKAQQRMKFISRLIEDQKTHDASTTA